MQVRERSGRWHFRFDVGGREVSGSTKLRATAANKSEAKRICARERELAISAAQAATWRRILRNGPAFVSHPLEELPKALAYAVACAGEVEGQFGVDLSAIRNDLARLSAAVSDVRAVCRGQVSGAGDHPGGGQGGGRPDA